MIDEDELRAIVREAIARHGQGGTTLPATRSLPLARPELSNHVSHVRLPVARGDDGPCLIEPVAGCSHCGFCQSFGH